MIDKRSGILLTDEYWDCECTKNYIHPWQKKKCHICGSSYNDQPDSHVKEVLIHNLPVNMTEFSVFNSQKARKITHG